MTVRQTNRGWLAIARTLIAGAAIGGIQAGTIAEPGLAEQPASAARYAIVIHGGAGSDPGKWTAEQREARTASLDSALRLGQKILADRGTSLDAVERVIRSLEDDPLFNAGRGAVMNAEGRHELDASIMDGRQRACGAVAGVTRVRNPISLARLVMSKTRHVLLAGPGADAFAATMQVDLVEPNYFSTEGARREWERVRSKAASDAADSHKGTVGCVALDLHGNLAAGTSTGGLTNKMPGRVGDSPIVGAGTYADNATCGVSCTGVGEHFIRHAVAHDLSARMAYKSQSLEEAAREIIHKTLKPGDGGLIAVDHRGTIVMEFNTPGMSRAFADSQGRFEVGLGRKLNSARSLGE